MKQKLKMFYECMKPNVALIMVTILVVSLLSVNIVTETKAADFGGRISWDDVVDVSENSSPLKGVDTTSLNHYTEYIPDEIQMDLIPNTVTIVPSKELGSRENPYAINSEEDLIRFSRMNHNDTAGGLAGKIKGDSFIVNCNLTCTLEQSYGENFIFGGLATDPSITFHSQVTLTNPEIGNGLSIHMPGDSSSFLDHISSSIISEKFEIYTTDYT